jgi:hypothetical protein
LPYDINDPSIDHFCSISPLLGDDILFMSLANY